VNPFPGIVLFSAIETATVAVWGALLGVGAGMEDVTKIIAIGVLFVGYTVEHVVAFNVGKGRPFFSTPRV
jgi:hypothetical protein